MSFIKIASDGRYLARCEKCGAWVEVKAEYPANSPNELFFEVLGPPCCGLRQTAALVREKDMLDFH